MIIPLTGKFSLRNLPAITITLILLNCIVYFTWQSEDNHYYQQAMEHYQDSGLMELEVDEYITYRRERNDPIAPPQNEMDLMLRVVRQMQEDTTFQNKLQSDQIIKPEDPHYVQWQKLKAENDKLLNKTKVWQYGFTPVKREPVTALTYMFLHGSVMHLLGNMIFLWLVGCVLEIGLGRIFYTLLYTLGGLCALGLYFAFNTTSMVPLVGASGAIAGLMGAYAVAFGRTRINIFYTVGFYFNYTKVRAIWLLPLWIGYELVQMVWLTGSNVAYLAHVGGLVGGAAMGFAGMKLIRREEYAVFEQEPQDAIKPLMAEAVQKIEHLDLAAARPLLQKVLTDDPSHPEALRYLFNIDKLMPESDRFHQTANRRLSSLCRKPAGQHELYDTFREYYRVTGQKPKISPDLLLRMSVIFADMGNIDEAMMLLGLTLREAPRHPGLPGVLTEVASICGRHNRTDCQDKIRSALNRIQAQTADSNGSH